MVVTYVTPFTIDANGKNIVRLGYKWLKLTSFVIIGPSVRQPGT